MAFSIFSALKNTQINVTKIKVAMAPKIKNILFFAMETGIKFEKPFSIK